MLTEDTEITLINWNVNIQSSPGVSNDLRSELGEKAAKMIAKSTCDRRK